MGVSLPPLAPILLRSPHCAHLDLRLWSDLVEVLIIDHHAQAQSAGQ
jgi:hypothetical protein